MIELVNKSGYSLGLYENKNIIEYHKQNGAIEVPICNLKFLLKKWDFVNEIWIEGATPEEINKIKKPQVPFSVSNIQLRKALIKINIMPSDIGIMLESLPKDTQYQKVKRELLINMWDYEIEMRRESADIIAFGSSLGLDSEKLDNLFILANTL